jgi:hypothetical protein
MQLVSTSIPERSEEFETVKERVQSLLRKVQQHPSFRGEKIDPHSVERHQLAEFQNEASRLQRNLNSLLAKGLGEGAQAREGNNPWRVYVSELANDNLQAVITWTGGAFDRAYGDVVQAAEPETVGKLHENYSGETSALQQLLIELFDINNTPEAYTRSAEEIAAAAKQSHFSRQPAEADVAQCCDLLESSLHSVYSPTFRNHLLERYRHYLPELSAQDHSDRISSDIAKIGSALREYRQGIEPVLRVQQQQRFSDRTVQARVSLQRGLKQTLAVSERQQLVSTAATSMEDEIQFLQSQPGGQEHRDSLRILQLRVQHDAMVSYLQQNDPEAIPADLRDRPQRSVFSFTSSSPAPPRQEWPQSQADNSLEQLRERRSRRRRAPGS